MIYSIPNEKIAQKRIKLPYKLKRTTVGSHTVLNGLLKRRVPRVLSHPILV